MDTLHQQYSLIIILSKIYEWWELTSWSALHHKLKDKMEHPNRPTQKILILSPMMHKKHLFLYRSLNAQALPINCSFHIRPTYYMVCHSHNNKAAQYLYVFIHVCVDVVRPFYIATTQVCKNNPLCFHVVIYNVRYIYNGANRDNLSGT